MRIATSDSTVGGTNPVSSADYWRRLFSNNPTFSSWQEAKQRQARDEIATRLHNGPERLRVLDFGIGNLGLYRCFDEDLLDRMDLTGISESQQHDPDDAFFGRFRVNVIVGSGLAPLSAIPIASRDCVISTYVLAYLDDGTRRALLKELGRILAPEGELILVLHHPDSRRNRSFGRSDPYWTNARRLYLQLLNGRYGSAQRTFGGLTRYLVEHFRDDAPHRRYLESYIRTAARFLTMFYDNGDEALPIPDVALVDCEEMIRAINREHAMTCRRFRPIENPETDIALPEGMRLSRLTECLDPADRSPIANFFCASKVAIDRRG